MLTKYVTINCDYALNVVVTRYTLLWPLYKVNNGNAQQSHWTTTTMPRINPKDTVFFSITHMGLLFQLGPVSSGGCLWCCHCESMDLFATCGQSFNSLRRVRKNKIILIIKYFCYSDIKIRYNEETRFRMYTHPTSKSISHYSSRLRFT